jgi:hypothetical protein
MDEIHFIVEKAPEGGFTARAVGADIFTESDDLPGLDARVEDAVHCHFDEGARPALIRLHLDSPNKKPAIAGLVYKNWG